MFILFIRLLKISYSTLDICFKNNNDLDDKEIKSLNYEFNDLIFIYISNFKNSKNALIYTDQFILDAINFQLSNHIIKRVRVYNFSKNFIYISKYIFISYSFYLILISIFINFIRNLATKYEVIGENIISNKTNNIVFFGFPEHSFYYEKNGSNEHINSVAEYFLLEQTIKQTNIFSLDEYVRPSKVSFDNKIAENISSTDRFKLKYVIKSNYNIFKLIIIFFTYLKEYKSYFNNLSLIPLSYFIYQKKISEKVTCIINPLLTKTQKPQLIALAYYDIGYIKYEKTNKFNFSYFVYSQNVILPTSKYIINDILNNNYIFCKEILYETSSSIFSTNLNNTYSFSITSKLINSLKKTINNLYNINLILDINEGSNFNPVNLGFETIEELNIKKNSILLFDVPVETIEKTLSRNLTGDITANSFFINEFFSEIFNFAKTKNLDIYIKPKYSISSTLSQEFYNSTIEKFRKANNIDVYYLNPYSKLKCTNRKFIYNFNFPFTSTFYSMNHLAEFSFFFIPSLFIDLLNINNPKVINGIQNLQNLNQNKI
jgi:hypothetical protein